MRARTIRLLFIALLVLVAPLARCVADRKYYKVLGIPETATEQEIKKAYRKAALRWHPDRNADNKAQAEQKFKEVANAYEVLADEDKRRIYDQYGEEGLEAGQPGQPQGGSRSQPGAAGGMHFKGDPFDMFKEFFGESDPFAGMGSAGSRRVHVQFGGSGPGGSFASAFGNAFTGGGGNAFQTGPGGFDAFGGFGTAGESGRPRSALYAGSPHVSELDDATFPKTWSSSLLLLHFYSSAQRDSEAPATVIRALASSLASAGLIKVGAVDCAEHQSLCESNDAHRLPAIKRARDMRPIELQLFVPGEVALRHYSGQVTVAALKKWATGQIPSLVQRVPDSDALQSFLHSCGAAEKGRRKVDLKRAGWQLCVLLLTDKAAAPPLYASLSHQFRGQVSFGMVRRRDKAASILGSRDASGPLLFAVCNGDLSTKELYEGPVKAKSVQAFVSRYSGGKRCRQVASLDADSLKHMRVGQLKAVLSDRGLRCAHCLDRGDYMQFILERVSA